jgi:2-methylcitrate dehydratase PrpD
MPTLSECLGHFVANLTPSNIPLAVFNTARAGIVDCMGVMFAGRDEPVVSIAKCLISVVSSQKPCQVLGDRGLAEDLDAAFINSVASHALDFDDTGLDGHPSAVLAPLVLALAQKYQLTWERTLCAYVAGYEVWAELISRDEDKHHGKGWHPSAVFGALASAAATAHARGLDARLTSHSLGIASSLASGLVSNFGSMTKPFQVGWAVRNGMTSVELAIQGMTACTDALESQTGFLKAISPQDRVNLSPVLRNGDQLYISRFGLNIKRYPICYAAHRIIDAALSIRHQVVDKLQDIARINIQMGVLQVKMLRGHVATMPLDAKFSAEFAVACALIHGHVNLTDLVSEVVNEDRIQQLMRKVVITTDDLHDSEEPLFSPFDTLSIKFYNATDVFAKPISRAKGHSKNPLSEIETKDKFFACAGLALSDPQVHAWWISLHHENKELVLLPLEMP